MDLLEQWEGKSIYYVSDSDLDGIAARIVAELYLPEICEFVPLNTAERDMRDFNVELSQGADVIIFVDITPTKELYDLLIQNKKEVFIFDHHISGFEMLGELPNYYFNTEKCGARIFFESITEGKRKNRTLVQFIELVDTYDLFKTKSLLWKNSKDLHNIMYSYVNWKNYNYEADTDRYNKFINCQIKKIQNNKKFYFTPYELSSAKKAEVKEDTSYRQAKKKLQFRVDDSGNNYAYTEMTSKLSFVSRRLLEEYGDKLDYLVAHSTWKKDNTKVSLRSITDFDVSIIAEEHGGGGHKQAAGIELEENFFKKFRLGETHLI